MTSTRLLFCLLVAPLVASAQQDFDKVQIKSTPVAGSVYMFEGSGGNIGVSAGPDGLLIVDDQFAPLAEKIEAALQKLDKGSLKFVLNTHWHGDHTGGNAHFGRVANIIATANVRKRLLAQADTAKEALPVVTFEDGLSVHFNGEEIRVVALGPGHTDGDAVIFFTKSGVVHMGDQFFNGMFPFVDLSSGGDVAGYVKNVGAMLQKIPDDAKVIPGHGPLATKADLQKFHQMLVATTDIVRKQIDAGKSLEQVKAAGLPEDWSSWGKGFIKTDRWIETIYKSFTDKH